MKVASGELMPSSRPRGRRSAETAALNSKSQRVLQALVLVVAAAASSCGGISDEKVFLFGDPLAMGARVYVDGALVGTMTKGHIMDHPMVRTKVRSYGIARCFEVGDTVLHAGDAWAKLYFKAALGEHKLQVVSVTGDTVSGTLLYQDSPKLEVSFRCREIDQTSW